MYGCVSDCLCDVFDEYIVLVGGGGVGCHEDGRCCGGIVDVYVAA